MAYLVTVEVYETNNGQFPFIDWLSDLDDKLGRQKIRIRIERMSLGNFGNCKALKNSISELRIDFGPGYRVYFTRIGSEKIVLLYGGSKRTQKKDILKAQNYLNDFVTRGKKHGKK